MGKWVVLTVIGGVVAIALVIAGFLLVPRFLPESTEESYARAHEELSGLAGTMRKADTAAVTFTGSLAGGRSRWAGTGVVRFGDRPSSDLNFSQIHGQAADRVLGGRSGEQSLQARQLRSGDQTFYRSPQLVPADRRPWINPDRTGIGWGGDAASPELGVTDLTAWLGQLDGISKQDAALAVTEELPDLDGAAHEYRVRCNSGNSGCPPPFGTELDGFIGNIPEAAMNLWLDDDGRLLKLDADFYADVARSGPLARVNSSSEGIRIKATFTLDKFGAPLTVTLPPASQVTTSTSVFPAS